MSERQKKKLIQKEHNRLKRRMIEKLLSKSRTNRNLAFNLNLLVDGWLELESDPGTFSLLIEDFGCLGVQVDEVYDLERKFNGPVLGFIFLFKWLNNRQTDRLRSASLSNGNGSLDTDQMSGEGHGSYVKDEDILSEMFFAKQIISNSCATHALISILLNSDYDKLNLGPILTRLKDHTKVMDPESRGYAIGNLPELAKAHNSHASFSSLYNRNKLSSLAARKSYVISGNQRTNLQQQNLHEAYHFVSFVPINGRLYELDGLKNYPIDHGPIAPDEDWTEKFRRLIQQRLNVNRPEEESTISNDIRYSLMAVVPDRRISLRTDIKRIEKQRQIIQSCLNYADIPNPPYSPLSNETLSASESGSTCNSPQRISDETDLDEEGKVDKYFFLRFDQQLDQSANKDDSAEMNDLQLLSRQLECKKDYVKSCLKEETDKRRNHMIDDCRRTHNYEPFIMTFLSMLAKHGNLADLIEKDLGLVTDEANQNLTMATKPAAAHKLSKQAPAQPATPQTHQIDPAVPTKPRRGRPPKNRALPQLANGTLVTPLPIKPKPKYKYVSTGRPVGRPRKHPLPVPPAAKTTPATK